MARRHDTLPFDTIRLEGGLFVADLLEKIAGGRHNGQREGDYHIPKGLKLHDEYGRAFQIATAQWKSFAQLCDRRDIDPLAVTGNFVRELLQDALGYHLDGEKTCTIAGRVYQVPFMACGRVPVFFAPADLTLDDVSPLFTVEGSGGSKRSVFRLAQEFLNASHPCTWALVSNGRRIRLMRDASTLTRPCFLEFDLETILAGNRYPDFAALWRVLHASRAGLADAPGTACIWEQWRTDGQTQGTRVRDGLRFGVTDALQSLGNGFLQHPANDQLRDGLRDGHLTGDGFFQELLRLVYRCLFLFTLEERTDEATEIPLLHPPDPSSQAQAARTVYQAGYSMKRLRSRVLRRTGHDGHNDLWQGLRIVFKALHKGEPRLALPALGGLFHSGQCPNLDTALLPNHALLEAMACLRWAQIDGNLTPVDYRNMGPEEVGSVYESLLELVPEVDPLGWRFGFIGITEEGDTAGHSRKITGSYYTPDNLVQELISSALDPVIEQRLAARPDQPIEALLAITVIDPACGSGHFLLAAARRLAERLAELRAVDGAVKPEDYRHALREVIAHCIFGVDKNPMALELARTALWIEGFEPGRPLSFLNHHLVCGDALLGVMHLRQLHGGIPKEAFKALSGDDATLCAALAKGNRDSLKTLEKRRKGHYMFPQADQQSNRDRFAALEKMPNASVEEIEAKAAAYQDFLAGSEDTPLHHAADCFVGVFLAGKTEEDGPAPTTADLLMLLYAEPADTGHSRRLQEARRLCRENQVLHWPLVFPWLTGEGGFDCVLANPPWERIKLQEEEFFASRHKDVATAKNKAERGRRIAWLAQGMLASHLAPETGGDENICEAEKRLHRQFIIARRTAEAASLFAHLKGTSGGRFPLTGVGDVNTYALFAEAISQLIAKDGRAGFIVPTGIATDDSTKAYFAAITQHGRLISLYDFENREKIFPAVDSRMKFCLLTLGESSEAHFSFFLTQTGQLADERRSFFLSPDDFQRINPNTGTCPIFRSRMDAELTRKIYNRVPVLIREARGEGKDFQSEVNPWSIRFMAMFHMANDSHLFADTATPRHLPLYEAKMVHQFDHHWASYHQGEDGTVSTADVPLADKQDPGFAVTPRYWVEARQVYLRISSLPKDLLKALQDGEEKAIVLAMTRLLFGLWLLDRDLPDAASATTEIYPNWQAFVADQPFAAAIVPNGLGFCRDKRVSPIEFGPHCLPDDPEKWLALGDKTGVNWHAVELEALDTLLAAAATIPANLASPPQLTDSAEVVRYANDLLEQTSPKWLMGWRDICRATDVRTLICSVIPRAAVGDKFLLMFPRRSPHLIAALIGCLDSLPCDFIVRQKSGGTSLKYFTIKQVTVLQPDLYCESDLSFIVPRVLELTYTSHEMRAWAEDLGCTGPPFPYDPERRAILRAELDAYYARLYGLTRDELRYILDPTDIMGQDYPSETFRVLKTNELRQFGEYRTRRLVLEAWDRLNTSSLPRENRHADNI